jgi:hypothetical protein
MGSIGKAPWSRRELLLVLLLATVAVALRVVPSWDHVIEGGRAVVRDPDVC